MSALIFSHQRCGSSNLISFLREAYAIAAASEPFNRRALDTSLPDWRSAPPEAINAHMTSFLRGRALVKHIYGQHANGIDEMLVRNKHVDRILFLYRRNVHAAALSIGVARRVGSFSKVASEKIPGIAPDEIVRIHREISAKRTAARKLCVNAHKPVLILTYEDLFSEDIRERREWVDLVSAFLVAHEARASSSPSAIGAAFDEFMSEAKKINSRTSLNMVENFEELKDQFPNIALEYS